MLRFTQWSRHSATQFRQYATKSKTTNLSSKPRVPTVENVLPDGSIFITRLPLSTPESSKAAPLLHKKAQAASKNLGESEIAEIRKLRAENPTQWTRKALAERFGCSEFFISIVSGKKQASVSQVGEAVPDIGYRKKLIHDNRVKRRALW
ncbi:mitochondrial ribosomal protein subunit L20-domain-containing protein [Umbelopsis sp. PMI_123]|nr:mitochondrial ribosomal protein subunit L20-domain-containing protein [Umbelopsis sp. PMI_123]